MTAQESLTSEAEGNIIPSYVISLSGGENHGRSAAPHTEDKGHVPVEGLLQVRPKHRRIYTQRPRLSGGSNGEFAGGGLGHQPGHRHPLLPQARLHRLHGAQKQRLQLHRRDRARHEPAPRRRRRHRQEQGHQLYQDDNGRARRDPRQQRPGKGRRAHRRGPEPGHR